MLRILSVAAALALSVQAASASPFGPSVSAGEGGQAANAGETPGLASLIMNRVAIMIVGRAGAGSPQHQHYTDEECETTQTAGKETPKPEEDAKKAEPVGPEPIYYGF